MKFLYSYFVFNLCFVVILGHWWNKKASDVDSAVLYGDIKVQSRSKMDCNSDLHRLYCRFKCRNNYGICLEGNCYCVMESLDQPKPLDPGEPIFPLAITEKKSSEKSHSRESKEVILDKNPALRHHIAHFCANLDKARECIRKCIKVGMAAFCGKDHVCYCDHRYSANSKYKKYLGNKYNYAGFHDMYEKYFGVTIKIKSPKEVEDDSDDIETLKKTTSKPKYFI